MVRVTAGFHAVGVVREERVHYFPLHNAVRRGKCALHLVIYDSVICQLIIRAFEAVAPALLPEDFRMLIDVWPENRVHVYAHQVLKVLVVAACNRINGLLRVSHRVEEGVERSLDELYERVLERIFLGSAQSRMLQDMRNSGAVRRRRPEADIEYFVVVVI